MKAIADTHVVLWWLSNDARLSPRLRLLNEDGFRLLRIENGHCARLAALPLHHRDPFDRMLVAQAQEEGVPLLSADAKLALYEVEIVS